jgi:hypothetical protein
MNENHYRHLIAMGRAVIRYYVHADAVRGHHQRNGVLGRFEVMIGCRARVHCQSRQSGATGRTNTIENDHGLAFSRNCTPPMRSPALGSPVAT